MSIFSSKTTNKIFNDNKQVRIINPAKVELRLVSKNVIKKLLLKY